MKKIILKITVLALVVGGFTACDSELDQLPFDELGTDQAYNTAQDFEMGIRGVYSTLLEASYYGSSDAGNILSSPDVMSDNTTLSTFGRGTKSTQHNWRYTSGSGNWSGLYNNAYYTIYNANNILYYAESFTGENKDEIVAEAKALRAMAHFDIVKTFAKIPTESGDANESLGIAYVTEADPNIQPSRESVGVIYDKIITDLTEAAANITTVNRPGRLSKDAVNVLLSRVYLYMGKNREAADAAALVSTPIAQRGSVVDVWLDNSQDGVVFMIPNPGNTGFGVTWSQNGTNNLKPEYVASYELTNSYASDDIRKEAYIIEAVSDGNPVNGIRKLLGKDGAADGKVDIKIFRAAEAKLNLAEALFNLGQETEARNALDAVRANRYENPPSGETGTALRDAIRLERRLEFAFEYQRFYDLKRWGLAIERDGSGDLADGTGTPSEVQSLQAGNFKFALPISQSIIDRNPNTQQNPGY